MKESFLFSKSEPPYSKSNYNKIEVLNCPMKSVMCKGHLFEVNRCYLDSEQYHKEKNFEQSIETLRSAFFKTTELKDHPCTSCALFFRSVITESMRNIYNELGQMSKGIFGTKRYQINYLSAEMALKEFENVKS